MLYAVLFQDNPEHEDQRPTHMSAHLAFLDTHAHQILSAGPLFAADGTGRGGMWLVEAADADTVEALTRADPFFPTGLRKSITVLEWRQVFRDGAPVAR